MMCHRVLLQGALAFVLACQVAHGAVMLKAVTLPSAEGTIVGTGFSPDSSRIAIVRYIFDRDTSAARYTIQIVDLKSGHEVLQTGLPNEDSSYTAASPHFIMYSSDGRYLLLATTGSDVLLILDTIKLQVLTRIVLYPETHNRRRLSGEGNRNFQGAVRVAVASNAELFGVLTHDGQADVNEIFIGSFSSRQIIRSWILGYGRAQTELGQTSLSLSEDGSRTAVSVVPPDGDHLPKDFNNLRLYKSESGELIEAVRTDGLVGQMALKPDDGVIASRIDTPGLFSKTLCIEKWSLSTKALTTNFCDAGRHVLFLGTSSAAGLVAGFACKIHKNIEGNVYSLPGRIDVWDIKSGALIAFSEEFPKAFSDIQISPNGSWVSANQMLWQVGGNADAQ
jgi:WD40 repeat protein